MAENFTRGVAADEAVTLREMKDYLLVTHNEDDALIERLIRAATDEFERYTDLSVIVREHTMSFDPLSRSGSSALRGGKVRSVTSVNLTDSDAVATPVGASDVVLSAGEYTASLALSRRYVWPLGVRGMTVVYEAGLGTDHRDVPEGVRQAIMDLAAFHYEHRGTDVEVPKTIMNQMARFRVAWF